MDTMPLGNQAYSLTEKVLHEHNASWAQPNIFSIFTKITIQNDNKVLTKIILNLSLDFD